jgi:hypothetical protein
MRAQTFRHFGQAASIDALTLTARRARLLALFHAFSGIYPSFGNTFGLVFAVPALPDFTPMLSIFAIPLAYLFLVSLVICMVCFLTISHFVSLLAATFQLIQ